MRNPSPAIIALILNLAAGPAFCEIPRGSVPPEAMHGPVGQVPGDARPPFGPLAPPPGDEIVCPAEFCRADGVFLTYETEWGSTQILMDIACEIAEDDTVYMFVKNSSEMNEARNLLIANGANIDQVRFVYYSQLSENCIWVRDYGPTCIYEDGAKAVVDFWYPFTSDDNVPIAVGAEFGLPVYTNNLLFSGGNLMTDGNGMGFATSIVYAYNPSMTQAEVRQLFRDYCGLDSLVVLPILDVENTKHIDVFCKLVNDTIFLVGEYASPGDGAGNNYSILNDIAAQLDTVQNLDGRDFDVVRIPMPPWEPGGSVGVTRTYTNSLISNHKVLVPVYGIEMDSTATEIYRTLCPDHEVIGIDSEQIIHRAGAVHCITCPHHSDNPLVVFHQELDSLAYAAEPAIAFTLSPKFTHTTASVFYRPLSQGEFTETAAMCDGGVWRTVLPPMTDDFHYYLAATATSGAVALDVSLPSAAPEDLFFVDVEEGTAVADAGGANLAGPGLGCTPNPFRTSTDIHFAVPEDSPARVTIYSILGRTIRAFSAAGPGPHCVTWDGRDDAGRPVATGVYLCRLETPAHSKTIKIVLLR